MKELKVYSFKNMPYIHFQETLEYLGWTREFLNLENSYLHKHNQIRAFLINNAFFCLGVDTYNQQ